MKLKFKFGTITIFCKVASDSSKTMAGPNWQTIFACMVRRSNFHGYCTFDPDEMIPRNRTILSSLERKYSLYHSEIMDWKKTFELKKL